MMDKMFLLILNMSFTASFVILFVLFVRLLIIRTPKIFSYALWSVVLFRLVCPFSFESIFSLLLTKSNPISQDIVYGTVPKSDTGITAFNNAANASLPIETTYTNINSFQIWVFIGRTAWLVGIAVLLIYSIVSLNKLKRILCNSVHEMDNIYIVERLDTPFVMGLFHPKIYLPQALTAKEKKLILLHEQTHIKRFDHVVKILSYFVLCLHWFNPLVWIAFFISGIDMEMACDESVIKQMGNHVKNEYSSSLLSLATGRRIIGGTPLAFGEGDTKSRIKNVLNYKKPTLRIVVVTVIAVIAVGLGLITNPKDSSHITGEEALWQSRTQYVGNNSAVGRIIMELSFPENLVYDSFELHTKDHPYDITVNFKTDTKTLNAYTGELNEAPLKRNAIIMFSLIENAEQITFTLDDGKNPYSIDYTLDWAKDFMEEKNLFENTVTYESFGEFIKEISVRINESIKDGLSEQGEVSAEKKVIFFVKDDESYSQSLTLEELKQTEEIARNYFTNEAPYYEGVVSIHIASDDYDLYQNGGIEAEYLVSNIIIYKVMTGKDKKDDNPARSISIARKNKNADWEIINQGY